MKKVKLSEVWKCENHKIELGIVNLISAPTGSGKTYFKFNTLIPSLKEEYNISNNEIVCLYDTSNLAESVRKDKNYNNCLKYRSSKKEIEQFGISNGFNQDKIEVMTFSKFGFDLKQNSNCFDNKKIIIVDEAHNLIKYRDRYDSDTHKTYTNVIDKLYELSENGVIVVLLTATPYRILSNSDLLKKGLKVYNFYGKVDTLFNFGEDEFSNIKNLIHKLKVYQNSFNEGYKALMYTDSIKSANKMVEVFKENGLNAVAIWSANSKTTMSDKQLHVRKSIIETGLVPFGVDILIINGAYETGINIKDETVQFVIVNNSSKEVITQVRGRIRHSIILLLTKSRVLKNENIKIELDEKWLNRRLFIEDKEQLVKELNLYNKNGRQLKWTSIKKLLQEQKYNVEDKKVSINNIKYNTSTITL